MANRENDRGQDLGTRMRRNCAQFQCDYQALQTKGARGVERQLQNPFVTENNDD